jgi:hypothetical protein
VLRLRKIVISLGLVLLLTSCRQAEEVIPQTANLRFCVHTVWNKTEYVLDGETDRNSNIYFTVTEPEQLKNLKFLFSDDGVTVTYLDLEKEIPLKSFEEDSPLRVVYEGFMGARNPEKVYTENGEYFTEFSLGKEDYRFTFSQGGLPLSIKTSKGNLIMFKGLQVIT